MPDKKKTNVVIVSLFMPGIYPSGKDSVTTHLLAPYYIKAAIMEDQELSEKYEVVVLDIPTTRENELVVQQIMSYQPEVVAYSLYMWNYDEFVASSKRLREIDPGLKMVLGGPMVSYTPVASMISHPQADIVVSGEGETRMKLLLKSDWLPETLSQIPQIAYRDEKKEVIETGGSFKEDVALIPSPYQTKALDLDDGEEHTVFIETFRGCPFQCQYCIWGDFDTKLNLFCLDQILKDIEIIYNNPNVKVIYFTDACIFYTRERAKIIFDKIASCKYKIPALMSLDILIINEEVVESLQKISIYENAYNFGMQSTNPETLDLSGRKSGVEIFRKNIAKIKKVQPEAEFSFDLLYGMPGDNFYHFRNTADFALSLSPRRVYFSNLLLLPGTPYMDDKEKHGFQYFDAPPYLVSANSTFSVEDMEKSREFALMVLHVLYFHSLRDMVYRVTEYRPELSRIELIETMFDSILRHVDPFDGIDLHVMTLEGNNMARRRVFNRMADPEICLLTFKSALELVRGLDLEGKADLMEKILPGIEYYEAICSSRDHTCPKSISDNIGQEKIDYVRFKWVVSEIPENKANIAIKPSLAAI